MTQEERHFYGLDREEHAADRDVDRPRDSDYSAGSAATEAAPSTEQRQREYGEPADERIDSRGAVQERGRTEASGAAGAESAAPLFPREEAESLRTRWDSIQTEFVDEPRGAVEKADALVGDVMQRLADGFSSERTRLERDWDRGDGVSTEDLRVALKRYRSFFDRLLSV